MGYMHIENLYRNQEILKFPVCYALEKIHGTSAHISWDGKKVGFYSGGAKRDEFVSLFDKDLLTGRFQDFKLPSMIIYGEAYGGKMQGMGDTYGDSLKFVVFDVKQLGTFVNLDYARNIAWLLRLEFVDYTRIPTTLEAIDAERDRPSTQAKRNGILEDRIREGVVLRPLTEQVDYRGNRVIAKHKRVEFSERQHSPKVVDPAKWEVQVKATEIADEWVTEMRLKHVLDKLRQPHTIELMRQVISAMNEDVAREGAGEYVSSKEVISAISTRTAKLYKRYLYEQID